MTDRMPPGWENEMLARLLGPPGRDGPVTCRLVTGTPRAEGDREPCDHDDGLRKCCGTRQLGPHAEDCRLTPSARDGMLDHERMYWHETEGRES